jgi:hypothetical protein
VGETSPPLLPEAMKCEVRVARRGLQLDDATSKKAIRKSRTGERLGPLLLVPLCKGPYVAF